MSKKLKHFALTVCLIMLSAIGAVLGGLENKTWWVLAASGAAGVVLQTLTTRVGTALGPRTAAVGAASAGPTLRQLPSGLPDFVGRERELSLLRSESAGEGAADVRLVFGPGGVGKTSLVIQAVEQEAARFPDGQLYVDLQGYGPNALPPEQVLVGWLRDLGLDERVIPATLTERSREFRSRMAGKRAAVILDNADSEQQVRPLLVGGLDCVTYVTSRSPLGGLPASMRIQLDGLSVDESVELLGRILGSDRVRGEEQPAHQLASASGGLPLALRVLAGRLVTEPRPLAALVNRLDRRRAAGRLLAEFTFGDLSVEASLALSREHLPARAQEAFDMLGLHPADDWPAWSVAALWDFPLLESEEILESLTGAQLVKVVTAGPNGDTRYRLHDLVREFAAAQALDHIPEPERRAAVVRLASAYLAVADVADARIHPAGSRHQGRVHAARYPVDPDVAERATDPFRWFLQERGGIAAVVAACHRLQEWVLCWELADAASVGFENLRLWDIGRRCADLAYDAAQRLGSDAARAATLRNLGEIDRETGQHERAVACLEESVTLFQKVRDSSGVIDASCNLSLVHMRWGSPSVAEGILQVALDEARSLADVRGEGWTWEILGESALLRGDRTVGSQSLQSAATLLGDSGERRGEAFARSNEALLIVDDIGWQPLPPVRKAALADDARPDVTRATELLDRADAAFTTIGDDRNLALVAVARIRLLILNNRDRDARRAIDQSWTMPGFELDWRLRGLLVHCDAVLAHRANAAKVALARCAEALSLVEPFGDRPTTACIRLHLGLLQRAAGRAEEATAHLEAARDLFRALDRAEATRTCEDLLRAGE